MLIHGVYVLLLAKTYTIGGLSQVYPIMRGTSPLLVPVIGVLVLSETLKLQGWVGILCAARSDARDWNGFWNDHGHIYSA
jgi:uncharacterized membrane protein